MSEENKIVDPWLYPGCICEVWDNQENHVSISYFIKISGTGFKIFGNLKNNSHGLSYDFYKPIGTPWDMAPKNAKIIKISMNGICVFLDIYENEILLDDVTEPFLIIFPWPACPDHLKGKTLPRPEWAKEG